MMSNFPASRVNPSKATSSNFMPSGVWRGKVVAVHDNATVDLIVPRLSGIDSSYRQIEVLGASGTAALAVGQIVYVAFAEGNPSDLVVLGPVRRPSYVGSTGGTTLGPWVECSYLSSEPYGEEGARVRKDSNGIVYLHAEVWKIDAGADLFTLPAGYEPLYPFSVAIRFQKSSGTLGTAKVIVGYNNAKNIVRVDWESTAMNNFTQIAFGGIAYPTT